MIIYVQTDGLKNSAPSISEGYQEQNSQYITVLLEQINHLRAENEYRTCIIQALVEK